MSDERFIERQADARQSAAGLAEALANRIYRHIVRPRDEPRGTA